MKRVIKLKDIAAISGFSAATVDRVINRRGNVKSDTVKRIMDVIQELEYRPNLQASNLAKNHIYRLGFVLPSNPNYFYSQLEAAIFQNSGFWWDNIEHELVKVDIYDPAKLAAQIEDLGKNAHALAVIALDHPLINQAIDRVTAQGVPVVTLISDAPNSSRKRYIGIDNVSAGRTAATLTGKFLNKNQKGNIAVFGGSFHLRDHAERFMGFQQIIETEFPELRLIGFEESRDSPEKIYDHAKKILTGPDRPIGIYNVGAGNEGIIHAIEDISVDLVYVAHELTQESRPALINGTIDAIINQNAGHEIRSASRTMYSLLNRLPINEQQEIIRIEIFLKENISPLPS